MTSSLRGGQSVLGLIKFHLPVKQKTNPLPQNKMLSIYNSAGMLTRKTMSNQIPPVRLAILMRLQAINAGEGLG